jgi:hypothetical protein
MGKFTGSGSVVVPDPRCDDDDEHWMVDFEVCGKVTRGVRYTRNGDGWPDEYEDERTIIQVASGPRVGDEIPEEVWKKYEDQLYEAVYDAEFEEDPDPRDEGHFDEGESF